MVSKYDKQNKPAILFGFLGFFCMIIGSVSMFMLNIDVTYILGYTGAVSLSIIIGIILCFKYYPVTWKIYKRLE